MKSMKKSIMALVIATTLCMLLSFAFKLNGSAATIGLSSIYNNGRSVTFSFPVVENTKYEIELYDVKMKLLGTTDCYTSASIDNKTVKNRAYYYRWRRLIYDRTTFNYVPGGAWTAAVPFTTITNIKVKLVNKKSKAVNLYMPKIPGVSYYTVYLSTKATGGFQKVKAVKPGKLVKLSKYRGKTFAYYKNYYFKVVPKIKKKNAVAFISGFYIRRVFR